MRGASIIVMLLATTARADTPSCGEVVDHVAVVMAAADASQGTLDRVRSKLTAACPSWSDPRRACFMAAADIDTVTRCGSDPDLALHVTLPAVSQDGTTLALPIAHGKDLDVALVALGDTTGEDVPVYAGAEDHSVAADTRVAGYVAVPFGTRKVDGIAMKRSGKRVTFRLGKKTVAKTTVKRSVIGFAVVRGASAWIYLELSDASWVAVAAKLPDPPPPT